MKPQDIYSKIKENVLRFNKVADSQLVMVFFLLLAYYIYYTFYFFFISNGFQKSILEKHHLESFNFEEIYQKKSFVLASFRYYYFIIPVFCACFFLFLFSKKTAWNSIESDFLKPTKYFILFIVLLATWLYAFSEYNYYYDKPYYFDRFLIIAIACLLFFYTWLLPFFIALIILWISQYNFPLEPIGLTDRKIIYELLILFLSYLSVKTLFKIKVQTLWILVFSIIASNYFIPAIYKMKLGESWYQWVLDNEIWVHLRGSFCSTWLSFLSDAQRESLFLMVKNNNFIALLFTLLLEFSTIFILLKRRFTVLLLSLLCLFHVVVFIISGVFFWKWLLINVVLITLLIAYKKAFEQIFTKQNLILSVAIIGAAEWFFYPVQLAWWDFRLYETMSYEVIDENDKTYTLSTNQLRPYEQMGYYQKLNYLVPDSIDIVNNDLTNHNVYNELKKMKTEDVKSWIHKNKRSTYNKEKVLKFEKFISTYFENYNNHINKKDVFIANFSTLDHGWRNKYPTNKFPENKCLKSFKVKLLQFYQTQEKSVLINENYIYKLQI